MHATIVYILRRSMVRSHYTVFLMHSRSFGGHVYLQTLQQRNVEGLDGQGASGVKELVLVRGPSRGPNSTLVTSPAVSRISDYMCLLYL
jgi:hypothetical protein